MAVALPESRGWLSVDAGDISVRPSPPFPGQPFKASPDKFDSCSVCFPGGDGLAHKESLDRKGAVSVLLRDSSFVRWGFGGIGLCDWTMGADAISVKVG